MSYLEHNTKYVPTGFRKLLHLNWPVILLLSAVSGAGFIMLYSVAGGSADPWMAPQAKRFGVGMVMMIGVAMVPIWFWRNISALAFGLSIMLLIGVDLFGSVGMGAQRWIDLGFIRLQPSELTKITLVMALAAYYDWLPSGKTSHPVWVIVPVLLILLPSALVLRQPDLGTALLLLLGGGTIMFLAGVHWAYFVTVIAAGFGTVFAVFQSRGTPWQLLQDYQYRRLDTFLDPTSDPLGASYNITQAKIAFVAAVCTDCRVLHCLGDIEQRSLCLAINLGYHDDILFVLCGQYGNGNRAGPCSRSAFAAGQLWRNRDACSSPRLWLDPKRPCA